MPTGDAQPGLCHSFWSVTSCRLENHPNLSHLDSRDVSLLCWSLLRALRKLHSVGCQWELGVVGTAGLPVSLPAV